MKTKLKDPTKVGALSESAYMMKLKTDMAALKLIPKEDGPVPFLLRTDFLFEEEEGTLFVAGITTAWKKFAKTQKWLKTPESKKTLIGTCVRKGDEIDVIIEKGKLTKMLFKKAIKANRVLKQYTWNILQEATESEEDEDDSFLDTATDDAEESHAVNEEDKAKAVQISKKLIEMVKTLQQTSDKAAKKELILQIDKLADTLYEIPDWEDYTPDNLEAALAKIEAMLKQQADSSKNEDKEKATHLSQEMIGLIKQMKGSQDKGEKAKLLEKLGLLKDQLEQIPNWEDYTPDNLEKVLAQLDEKEEEEIDKEVKIKEKEKSFFEEATLKTESLYTAIAKADFSNLSGLVKDIQSALKTWETFEDKVKERPKLADALEKQENLKAQLLEMESIAAVVASVEVNLAAFKDAVSKKDKAKALELQGQILAQLP